MHDRPYPNQLQQDLQQQLLGAYALERELGGGGMSRLFVATEISLGRRVVIKVLPPELAAKVSIDRFRREIQLAAQLQHSHIVPVLTAGEADGLLYYTMPLVEGEPLRARLAREKRLDPGHVVLILRDVLNALAYAHRRDVVHRDIKPENILLSEGGAMVADFGIAKALHVAGAAGRDLEGRAAPGTITDIGVMVGTPAYTAPEQAVADPTVDRRADIYSVGAVAYEMLCGEQLFGGRPAHLQLAAHALETPPSLESRQPDIPAPLAALVMRCLEKDPERRPQRAEEVLQSLDEVASASGRLRESGATSHSRRRTWRRRLAYSSAIALVMLAGAGYAFVPRDLLASVRTLVTRKPPQLHVNRVVVAPFENLSGDARFASLGVMAADWIAEGLARLPNLEVVDARTTLATSAVVREIPWPLRTRDQATALAHETGAGLLITGTFYRDADTLRFQAKVADVTSGKIRAVLPMVSGPASSPALVLEELRRPIIGTMRSASDTVVQKPLESYSAPPSLEAYDGVIKGLEAYFRGDSMVFSHFERSARLDTNYATPVVLLAFARWYRFQPELTDTVLRRVDRLEERLSAAERAMADHVRALMRADGAAAVRAAEEFVRVTPGSMESPLLLASVALTQRRPRLALEALARTDPDRGLNLAGSFYWNYHAAAYEQLGDQRRALSYAREGRRRFPSNGALAYIELRLLAQMERFEEARERLRAFPDRFGVARPVNAGRLVTILEADGHLDEARRIVAEWRPRMEALRDTSRRVRVARYQFSLTTRDWAGVDSTARVVPLDAVPPFEPIAARAVAAIHLGRPDEARRADSVLAAQPSRYAFGLATLGRARIAAHLGDRERAITLLKQAFAEGAFIHNVMPHMRYDPLLEPLRGHPGFEELDRPR